MWIRWDKKYKVKPTILRNSCSFLGTSTRSVMKDYSEQLHHATIIASSVIEASVEAIAASKSEQTVGDNF